MQEWQLKRPYICFTCFLNTSTQDLIDVSQDKLEKVLRYKEKVGAWHICEIENAGKKFILAFYRFRILVFYDPKIPGPISTDVFIRDVFLPTLNFDFPVILGLLRELFQSQVTDIYYYSVVVSPEFVLKRTRQVTPVTAYSKDITWIDDGVTTFYYRIFDSRTNKSGFVRVSKWLTISYGLGDSIVRELINLVYEKIIYSMKKRGSPEVIIGDDEFALLDGLARYTVPTELNLFLQGLAIRVTLYIAFLTIVLAILGSISALLEPVVVAILYVVLVVVAIVGWRLINKVPLINKG